MDLKKLDVAKPSEQGFEFEYVSEATGQGTGVFLTVIGEKSEPIKAHIRKALNQIRMRNEMRKKRGKDEFNSVEEDEQFGIDLTSAKIIGWRGIEEDGKPWPYSKENAKTLCEMNDEIVAQVNKNSGDLSNFLKSK